MFGNFGTLGQLGDGAYYSTPATSPATSAASAAYASGGGQYYTDGNGQYVYTSTPNASSEVAPSATSVAAEQAQEDAQAKMIGASEQPVDWNSVFGPTPKTAGSGSGSGSGGGSSGGGQSGSGSPRTPQQQPTPRQIQDATRIGVLPTDFMRWTPMQQQSALAAENPQSNSGFANLLSSLFSGPILSTTPNTADIQRAVAAGYTPAQFAALTPAQRAAALHAAGISSPATAGAAMPLLLIGGAVIAALALSGGKGKSKAK